MWNLKAIAYIINIDTSHEKDQPKFTIQKGAIIALILIQSYVTCYIRSPFHIEQVCDAW